jgi:hypothetical protein
MQRTPSLGGDFEAGLSMPVRRPRGSLRRTRGDAAGVELAASLVDRMVMNVGSDPSFPPAAVVGRCVVCRWRRVVAEVL